MNQTSPTGALPMPISGIRTLSPREVQLRAQAMACLRDQNSKCQGQVYINLFFDGTGNNWDWEGTFIKGKKRSTQTQRARDGHSNVARLYDARIQNPDIGLFNFYIPGVGTPFKDIDDSGAGFFDGDLGAGAARRGADRINWGIIQVFNALHRYSCESNLLEPDKVKSLVELMSKTQLFEDTLRYYLFKAVGQDLERAIRSAQREVKSINVAVFGFSRGAAQARAFVHWLFENVKPWNNGCGHNLAGVPLQLTFLGIFDTVASVGIAGISRVFNGRFAWASGEMMSIHPEVKQCVHFTALHEQRINFPLDLAMRGKEVLYPGMHSDVGGGYTPGGQGKNFVDGKPIGSAKLSQIPLIDMHHEAIKAGVPLMSLDEIMQRPELARYFSCHPQLIQDYNAWLTGHGVPGGNHADQIRGHARQYVQWKGMRLWNGPQSEQEQPYYRQADEEDRYDLDNARRDFGQLVAELTRQKNYVDEYQKRRQEYPAKMDAWMKSDRRTPPPPRPIQTVSADLENPQTKELLEVVLAKKPVPSVVARLFDNYAHDSLAGFYMSSWTELNVPGLSTNGYLRYRSIFNVNSSQQAQVCVDPATTPLPPMNLPTVGQAFDQVGRAMAL